MTCLVQAPTTAPNRTLVILTLKRRNGSASGGQASYAVAMLLSSTDSIKMLSAVGAMKAQFRRSLLAEKA